MIRCVASAIAAAFIVSAEPACAQDRNWLVGGLVTGGTAWEGGSALYGGWGVTVEAEGRAWAPRIAYERIGLARSCQASLPPQCAIDVPDGRVMTVGLSRDIASRRGTRLLLRPEAGAALWTNNASDDTFLGFLAGGSTELRVTVGTGAVSVGGSLRASRSAKMVGALAGLSIRL